MSGKRLNHQIYQIELTSFSDQLAAMPPVVSSIPLDKESVAWTRSWRKPQHPQSWQ